MKLFHIRKLLDSNKAQEISKRLKETRDWHDGLNSGGGHKGIKNNEELSDNSLCQMVNDTIMQALDEDSQFLNFTIPTRTGLNLVSKTSEGGYYRPHQDNWKNGDFSTTVFLNDPAEYVGGEICLYYGGQGEDEKKIKLDAGWAVTYPTGIVHRVNNIKSGVRYVSVFWTNSLIKDEFIRHIYRSITDIRDRLNELNGLKQPSYLKDCSAFSQDPEFMFETVRMDILRRFGDNQ